MVAVVDNDLYNRPGDLWWDETQPLSAIRTALNPGRLAYFRLVFDELSLDPRGKTALDVGCGGGLLAEEVAHLGCNVTGVDPSASSLATARAHAARSGLAIEYRQGTAEALPFPNASFDLVYCCDVLEHVDDVGKAVAEAARALRPGGVYLYDTINRTFPSRLVYIKLFQDWGWTSWMPPNLHAWEKFIKPAELQHHLEAAGLQPRGVSGLKPRANPLQLFRLLRARKRGQLSYSAFGARAEHRVSGDKSILYAGYAVKPVGTAA
ncbi:MAG TPA: bifunctional 2-polyprenyl-6-hydroxyphenol methylase/3-demethylubiquinol 3-O-methyltransferase UbiG [Dehalococcoidia bacterium]|jgi:2-polyprenyl-6-hydroxyphenyl methylase/3-demethylubiquinone-9 3-methyltransferase|nr:bifunctional 2-polyprenyl-6-hydroxyphenol methylase/3-demethylubiquinol 3-O-methyltransferase UbiG [Dehalococcoidia bacterium]